MAEYVKTSKSRANADLSDPSYTSQGICLQMYCIRTHGKSYHVL